MESKLNEKEKSERAKKWKRNKLELHIVVLNAEGQFEEHSERHGNMEICRNFKYF